LLQVKETNCLLTHINRGYGIDKYFNEVIIAVHIIFIMLTKLKIGYNHINIFVVDLVQ
jgi:hypothetical protein